MRQMCEREDGQDDMTVMFSRVLLIFRVIITKR